ncbi:tetratricopeptide repeat protein [Minwuia sp.]|uniref:tetratricopeptide repeat protein n=1 Tax=Minwuia sp. TaxID=2493630 RepID=UPI003A8F9BF6
MRLAIGTGILLLTATLAQAEIAGHEIRLSQSTAVAKADTQDSGASSSLPVISGEGIGAFLAGRQAKLDGDTAVASSYFARALAEDPDNEWLVRRSFLLDVAAGRIDRALPLAQRVLNRYEQSPVANLVISTDHIVNKRYGKAEALVDKASARGSMQLLAPLFRAWAAYGSDDVKRALARLKPLEKKKSFAPFHAYHKAMLLGASGDPAGALDALDALPDGVSLDLRSRLVYAALLEKRDGPDAAMAYLKGLTARYGENPVLRAYLYHGRPIAEAFPVTTATDGLAEALYGAASALSRESVSDVSMIYLRLALYVKPDMDVAQALLGDMLEEDGHWEEAIAAFGAISDDSPYKWAARIRSAWALDSVGRTDEAAVILREMSKERPDNLTTLATLADMLRGHKRFEEAAKVYAETIERMETPGARHWSIFYAHGIALERTGRWEEGEKSLIKALELNPDQPLVMNYLGYSWADKKIRLPEAVAMIQKAVDLRPADGYVVDSLGWAYYQKGDYETAVRHLERAAELRPEDPVINDHLGDAYWHVGRRMESCFQWRHALALDPDEETVPVIRAKMSKGLEPGAKDFRGCRF